MTSNDSLESTSHLPRVLLCVDKRNWALDFKSTNIIKNLDTQFEFRKCTTDDEPSKNVTNEDILWADVVLTYYWPNRWQLKKYNDILAKKITIGGISSPSDLEGQYKEAAFNYLNSCDATFVHNLMLYEQYKGIFSKPFYLNPNGVDTEFYCPGPIVSKAGPLIAGWAGSLTNHGNIRGYYDIILPAIEKLEGIKLSTAAREDKWRSPNEMLEFYRTLDVYLVASQFEGTPNPALEAAACGVPLIASRVGNMPELIKDGINGYLIDRTVDALMISLKKIRDDAELRKNMRTTIRKDILAWDWSLMAQNYGRMIKETVNKAEKH